MPPMYGALSAQLPSLALAVLLWGCTVRNEKVCLSDGDYHLKNLKHLLSTSVCRRGWPLPERSPSFHV